LHSLVRRSGPFLGADLLPAERHAQVLSRMPLAAPARSAGLSSARPSTALCLSRLGHQHRRNGDAKSRASGDTRDRIELVECHSEATRGRSPVSPDRPTKIVLRRSVESAQYTSIEFGHRCREAGVRPSMGSVGDAYDTPCARASSRPSNANGSSAAGSRRRPRREAQCSPSSRASTIRDAVTHRSDTSHRLTTNTGIMQQLSIATHTSLPPCSRPSRTSPSGGRRKRPSLTATARGSRLSARVGTKEWLRRGRTKECRTGG
jgi:hypothetical protein